MPTLAQRCNARVLPRSWSQSFKHKIFSCEAPSSSIGLPNYGSIPAETLVLDASHRVGTIARNPERVKAKITGQGKPFATRYCLDHLHASVYPFITRAEEVAILISSHNGCGCLAYVLGLCRVDINLHQPSWRSYPARSLQHTPLSSLVRSSQAPQ
jgi:hypothetical protein